MGRRFLMSVIMTLRSVAPVRLLQFHNLPPLTLNANGQAAVNPPPGFYTIRFLTIGPPGLDVEMGVNVTGEPNPRFSMKVQIPVTKYVDQIYELILGPGGATQVQSLQKFSAVVDQQSVESNEIDVTDVPEE
jgi:hypothetical protein